jgi:hypothetical protein
MKTITRLSRLRHLSFLGLLLFAWLALAPRAPAQSLWGNALSPDGADDHVVFPSGV